jgi:hypothetical protein
MAWRRSRRWTELSGPERAGALALVAAQLGLLAAALNDLRRRPPEQVRGDKRLWVLASFVNLLGPLAYLSFGRWR